MHTIKRVIQKFLIVLIFLILLVEIGARYLFHNTIIDKLNQVAKNSLESELVFTDVSISALRHFPNLTIAIDSLSIKEGQYQILRSESIELLINPIQLYQDNFVINKILIEDARFFAPIDSIGGKHMIKPKPKDHKKSGAKIKFDIPNIEINRLEILVDNAFKGNRIKILADSGRFQLQSFDDLLEFNGSVDGTRDSMISKGKITMTAMPVLALETTFRINTLDKKKMFDGTLGIADSRLKAYGVLSPVGNGNLLDITLNGDDGNLDDYISIFPQMKDLNFEQLNPDARMKLKVYQSGYVDPTHFPFLDMKFEITNARFSRKGMSGVLDSVNFKGEYSNGRKSNASTSKFLIKYGTAIFENSFVHISGSIENFNDPFVNAKLSSQIQLEDVGDFLNFQDLKMNGAVKIDMDLNGLLSEIKLHDRSSKEKFEGSILFDSVNIKKDSSKLSIQKLNGKIDVKNSVVKLAYLNGYYNGTDIQVNGKIDNFLQLIQSQNNSPALGKLNIQIGDLRIPQQSVSESKKEPQQAFNYSFFPKLLNLKLNVAANKLKYDNLEISRLEMGVILSSDSIQIQRTVFEFEKGKMVLTARSQIRKDGSLNNSIWLKADLNHINLDKYISTPETSNAFIPPDLNFYADIKINELSYKTMTLGNLQVNADYEDFNLNTSKLSFSFPFGRINSGFTMAMGEMPYALRGSSNIDLQGFNVDSLKNYYKSIQLGDPKKEKDSTNNFDIEKFILTIQSPQITYENYQVTNLSTNLYFRNNRVRLNQAQFDVFGGEIDLSGLLYNNEENHVNAYCDFSAKNVDLSKVIDGFKGANQELFSGQNFKGKVGIDGQVLLSFNEQLDHQEKDMIGKIKLKLDDAQIINFKPITESLKFIKQSNRESIYLTNQNLEVLFHNSEVIIPTTTFQTTLSNIEFFGYHSTDFAFGFDMQISVSELLFKSRKKKKASVKRNKKNVKLGHLKYYLSARTIDGKMDISSLKRKTYRMDLDNLNNRYAHVDSVLLQIDKDIEK
jgi:hypothetical protein